MGEATMTESVVVAGCGPGLGDALARAFAAEGYRVAMLSRDTERLAQQAAADPARLMPIGCDVTQPDQVAAAFARAEQDLGPIAAAVFNAGGYRAGGVMEITPEDFEFCWRVGAYAGLLVGQAAVRAMLPRKRGTLLFTGATASLRGGAKFLNLASPKFALRALAQSFARDLGPRGIHVAHVIVDGQIRAPHYEHLAADRGPESLLEPDALAAIYVHLHRQPRSVWTQEIDARPWSERF
jgi:NAD(P)-dependent dehydrogenase (short-subunit alcohol dehydrogenase family)